MVRISGITLLFFLLATSAFVTTAYSYHHSFTYYDSVLSLLQSSRYKVFTVEGYLKDGPDPNKVNIILRHDVDFSVKSAEEFAKLEEARGIRSTYYIRVRGPYNASTLKDWLSSLNKEGFEIGLHYEDPYVDNWSWTLAVRDFGKDLALLRTMTPVKTVCAHGNSEHQKYNNDALFNFTTLQTWNLQGEAALSFQGKGYQYFSDSNNAWVEWYSIIQNAQVGTTLYLLIHPDWWHGVFFN